MWACAPTSRRNLFYAETMAVIDRRTTPDVAEPLDSAEAGQRDFFAASTLQELMKTQGAIPMRDISVPSGVIADDELADFVGAIYAARERVTRPQTAYFLTPTSFPAF
jgi:hypothetical protein